MSTMSMTRCRSRSLHLPPGAPWWIFAIVVAALALHIGGGSIGILSGYAAVFARKGAQPASPVRHGVFRRHAGDGNDGPRALRLAPSSPPVTACKPAS